MREHVGRRRKARKTRALTVIRKEIIVMIAPVLKMSYVGDSQ